MGTYEIHMLFHSSNTFTNTCICMFYVLLSHGFTGSFKPLCHQVGTVLTYPPIVCIYASVNRVGNGSDILIAYSAPSLNLNECWIIVNWTPWTNQNTQFFIHENGSKNIVCEMAAIVSKGWWVNGCFRVISYFMKTNRLARVECCIRLLPCLVFTCIISNFTSVMSFYNAEAAWSLYKR